MNRVDVSSSSYLRNVRIDPERKAAVACLIVGANPRMEASLLNTRLRKAYLNAYDVALVGHDSHNLGDTLSTLEDIVEGRSSHTE